ncbi:ROK family protein [Nocardioides sp. DS6]|uniref:ROK family protein n=1 Tax=Nocardioides eburneus TaxID=3231482 RepID=A0ABV3SWR7_9ACTN
MTDQPWSAAAVDIGGTKIAAARVDSSARVVDRRLRATPRGGGAPVLDAVAALIDELVRATPAGEAPIRAVGIGSPGVVDTRRGVVVSATGILPGWTGTAVRAELERRLGLPVAVDNDVRAMARGELSFGAARGASDVLFVSLGTGVGGAFARDGIIVSGRHGTAGEIAHLLVPERGAIACGCGRTDHLEAVASGPAITARYAELTGDHALDLITVASRLRDRDTAAATTIRAAAVTLGRAIAGLVTAFDVERVVVGGGAARIGPPLLDPLAEALRAEVLPSLADVDVVVAELGTDAPLVGAALLATDRLARTEAV